ncbi:unnamed protein product [Adineta steineri]|uniref:Uncharacterized protein n=1 Tax=Adineta steineri TaxID=433720 RepID=A0A813N1E5_9BILA|nr:unnamed protein product [Adineta steineri]CAF1512923.1 unnamed protein product [Adineta steineri]
MVTTDTDLLSDFREQYTFSPTILTLTFSNDSSNKHQRCLDKSPRKTNFYQEEKRPTTSRMADFDVRNSNIHDSLLSSSSYTWHRRPNRVEEIAPAPDLVYRYSHMEEPKTKKSTPMHSRSRSGSSTSRSLSAHSPRSPQRSHRSPTPSSPRKYPQQYNSIYEYILQSIKDIEQNRNLKQEKFSTLIKRPQNDDIILQRALSARKHVTTKIYKKDLQNAKDMMYNATQSDEQTYL